MTDQYLVLLPQTRNVDDREYGNNLNPTQALGHPCTRASAGFSQMILVSVL